MKILAVDTSCDESCAAILDTDSWKLLSDVVYSHVEKMSPYGGIVPEVASREHLKALPLAVSQALSEANLSPQEIDHFAVTFRPGLIGALLVGVSYVKAMAFAAQKPFSGMNHIESHLFSPLLGETEGQKVPNFPWLALVVSGGHTELFYVRAVGDFDWIGGTLDDAAGEAFDKVGKLVGLGYPAGPLIDKMVREKASAEDRKAFQFPRAQAGEAKFSYSGLKTAVALTVKKLVGIDETQQLQLVASAQEAILEQLTQRTREIWEKKGRPHLVVTGGVACNSRLRELLPEAYFPRPRHCSDNAAMVALLAGLYQRAGKLKPSDWDLAADASAGF